LDTNLNEIVPIKNNW
jgi:hypothetical protein